MLDNNNKSSRKGIWVVIIPILLSILGSMYIYYLTQQDQQAYEDYKRKEARYVELVSSIKGFSTTQSNSELRQKFIDELNLCWLYCPDEVIKASYNFLNTVTDDVKQNETEQKEALGKLMLTIRKDLISRKILTNTNLTPSDFKLLRSK